MLIELEGHHVAYTYSYLSNAQGLASNEPVERFLPGEQKLTLEQALEKVEGTCRLLSLTFTLAELPRLREAIKSATSYGDLQTPINIFRLRMHDELKARLFLYVPPIEAGFYGVKQPFGAEVEAKFTDAISDMEEAGNCIALGRSTAAVFHLMRILERGVQSFGLALSVLDPSEKNWQNILDEVNKKIKALPDATVNEKSIRASYAEAAANLFNVKLAWRNPVMHPKASYTPEESADIYDKTRSFMKHLAGIL